MNRRDFFWVLCFMLAVVIPLLIYGSIGWTKYHNTRAEQEAIIREQRIEIRQLQDLLLRQISYFSVNEP